MIRLKLPLHQLYQQNAIAFEDAMAFLFQRLHSAAAAMQAGAPEQLISSRIIYLNFPPECR